MSSINISFTSHCHGPLIHPWMANQATLPYVGLVYGTARQLCWLWHQVVQASPYLPRGHQYLGKNSRGRCEKVMEKCGCLCWFTKKLWWDGPGDIQILRTLLLVSALGLEKSEYKYIHATIYITYPNGSKINVLQLLEFCIFPVPSHGCNVASFDIARVVDRCDAISRHRTPRRKQEHLEVLALLQDHTWDLIGFLEIYSRTSAKKQLLKARRRPEVVRFASTLETWWCWKMSPKIMGQWGQSMHLMICGKTEEFLDTPKNLIIKCYPRKKKAMTQWPISETFPFFGPDDSHHKTPEVWTEALKAEIM